MSNQRAPPLGWVAYSKEALLKGFDMAINGMALVLETGLSLGVIAAIILAVLKIIGLLLG